jgi:hypothetical protein
MSANEADLWLWLDTDNEDAYPTGDISSKALSKTATAANSCVKNAAVTFIRRVQIGPLGTAGVIQFKKLDGTTVIREISVFTPGANVATNQLQLGFIIKGPWMVNCNVSGATCDVYVDFQYLDAAVPL